MTASYPVMAVAVTDGRPLVRKAVVEALRERLPSASITAQGGSDAAVYVDGVGHFAIDHFASLDGLIDAIASGWSVAAERELKTQVSSNLKVHPTPAVLTPRQSAVRVLVDRGYTASGIARELGISARTVEAHKRALKDRLVVARHTT